MPDVSAKSEVAVALEKVPGAPTVFRIVGDHPDEDGIVHVGPTFDTIEDAQEALEAKAPPGPSPGGPPADERLKADPVAEAKAQGYKLHVVQLVPDKVGTDDAGQKIAVTSKWVEVG